MKEGIEMKQATNHQINHTFSNQEMLTLKIGFTLFRHAHVSFEDRPLPQNEQP